MNKPICVKCGRYMNVERNGLIVGELLNLPKGDSLWENTEIPTTYHAMEEEIYRIFSVDVWKCPVCGVEILNGFGAPVYRMNPDFAIMFNRLERLVF